MSNHLAISLDWTGRFSVFLSASVKLDASLPRAKHLRPGNIRELQHVLERALITAKSGKLHLDVEAPRAQDQPKLSPHSVVARQSTEDILTVSELRTLEADNIRRALARAGEKIYGAGGAAELLDIKPTTLASRIKSLRIERNTDSA